MPPRIFISYRREDAAGDAGRLADHLNRRFGAKRVFLDIDTIDPGTDFVGVLRTSLQETAAMLVVIGPQWVSLRDKDGARRLDSPSDFVRLEVETALARGIPVVPVLMQGARMPRAEDLPASLAALATRQAAAVDHAEFHADAERLCDRLSTMIAGGEPMPWPLLRRWWPAAALAAALAVGLAGYYAVRTAGDGPPAAAAREALEPAAPSPESTEIPARQPTAPLAPVGGPAATSTPGERTRRAEAATLPAVPPSDQTRRAEAALAEASAQRRRGQFVESLATLARARELTPASDTVRQAQEDVAMEWIRNVRVEGGKSSFGEAIKPALAVVDASLPSATGVRRADLLAHQGWATFLMWRDGNRQLNPAEWYREALALDPVNPYANAMLAHWVLFQDDNVPRAVKLFDTAVRAGRATEAVRVLQWAAYGNTRTPEAEAERVRLADAMRRDGTKLTMAQAQALWSPYYFATPVSRERDRRVLLAALPPDDYISTLQWAFDEYAAREESRRQTIRFYVALLHEKAGRVDQAIADLRALDTELSASSGSLRDAVRAALEGLQPARGGRRSR